MSVINRIRLRINNYSGRFKNRILVNIWVDVTYGTIFPWDSDGIKIFHVKYAMANTMGTVIVVIDIAINWWLSAG